MPVENPHCIAAPFVFSLISTDCRGNSGTTGLHYLNLNDRIRLDRKVMTDLYIALRADKFLGNGLSKLSAPLI
jgi:hypothetical protein